MDDLALDHRLVGAIYHGVLDPSAYAEIAQFFETTVVDRLVDRAPDDLRGLSAVSEVLQHLSRAEHIFDLSNRGPSRNLEQLLEAQPYVAFAVTTTGRIVRANSAAEATITGAVTNVLDLPLEPRAEQQIRDFLRRMDTGESCGPSVEAVHGWSEGSGQPRIVLLERMQTAWNEFIDIEPLLPLRGPAILVKSTDAKVDDRVWGLLRCAFDLTGSEADIVRLLVEGNSLQDVARVRDRSMATIRTQLKAVFQKTGARSQGDLIRVATMMALLTPWQRRSDAPATAASALRAIVRQGRVTLPDGRVQLYVETGARDGQPVLFLQHSARPDFVPDVVKVLAREGLRVISPVRPGSWGMARADGRWTPERAADDLARLAAELDLAGGVLAGYRTGAAYAYALAARHPRLFRKVVLVDTGAPLDSGDKIKRMPPWPRMLFWIARNVPQALMLQYRYGAADFFRGPDRQKRAVHFYFRDSPADMQLVQDPVYAEIVRRNVAYCLEDPDQLSRDFAFWAQDRSHLARKILETTPIVFLHGAENRWFPVCDVEDFCKAHDRATVRIVEGESYFLIYRRPELLASCLLE